jgi:hypothetical protein
MDAGFVLRAERVFDGERLVPGGAAVFVEGGRITAVEPVTAVVPPGWQLAERAGATLLPGLIDAHVHLCGDSRDGALDRLAGHSDGEQAEVIEAGLRRQLAAGVTAVRDLGDRCFATLAWRRRPGLPEVVVSGPVPLEYSIAWLICAVTCGREAVMVGWPGAAQDYLLDSPPCSRPRRPGVPQGPGQGGGTAGAPARERGAAPARRADTVRAR